MYAVKFKVPFRELGKADVEFKIKRNGNEFGTLRVSKGAIVWFPRKTRVNGRKILWNDFDRFMREQNRKEKRSRSPRRPGE